MKKIVSSKFEQTLIEPGIIEMKPIGEELASLKDLEDSRIANVELSEGKKYCILLNAVIYFPIAKGVRERLASKEYAENRMALAIVVSALATRIVATFFISMNKPATPTKIFSVREEAITWLRTFTNAKQLDQ